MKALITTLVLVLISSIGNQLAAQPSCITYHKQPGCSQATQPGYIYNSQSKSGLFIKGTTSNVKAVLYNGFDYSISICADKSLGQEIGFILKDAISGEVLYDNATDNKATHMEFSCERTRNTKIIITIPGKPVKGDTGACLGILIEQKQTTKKAVH